jgi:lactate dehydrogenase-like 2-hydroxyacid dehydrogenase
MSLDAIAVEKIIYLGPPEALVSAREVLEPSWKVVAPQPTAEAVSLHLADAIAIVDASMQVTFDQPLLDQAPNLRAISTATTGADHIDARILTERGVPLLTLAGEKEILHNLTPAAELSWALLMACSRQFRGAVRDVLEGTDAGKIPRRDVEGQAARSHRLRSNRFVDGAIRARF